MVSARAVASSGFVNTAWAPKACIALSTKPSGLRSLPLMAMTGRVGKALSIGLERLGYEVAALDDPAEAIEVIAEAPELWDMVVTDHLMSNINGLELCYRLKYLRDDLIVILCTGLNDGVIGERARLRGVDAFFPKPVEPEQIAAAICRLKGR
jgi:CheY-like chemotaxis protein